MIRKVLFALSLIIIPLPGNAQDKTGVHLENIKMSVIDNKIIINYDIINSSANKVHQVGISFISSDNRIIVPKLLSGDIGTGLSGGSGKTISWDITDEIDYLNYGLKPYMYLDGLSIENIPKGGPEKMFLSLLIPGLGDYFVANSRDMKIKPYMRLAAVAGFFALGVTASEGRWVEFTESEIIRREYVHGQGWMQIHETISLAGDTNYKFFRHDAELFYALGAAVWIADVFWVLNKGYNNKLLNTSMKNSNLSFSAAPGGFALTLTF